jgi:hypothetical protein
MERVISSNGLSILVWGQQGIAIASYLQSHTLHRYSFLI